MGTLMKTIRIITTAYELLFELPNLGTIMCSKPDGLSFPLRLEYIDAYHFSDSNGRVWHICDFAEWMRENNIDVRPIGQEGIAFLNGRRCVG